MKEKFILNKTVIENGVDKLYYFNSKAILLREECKKDAERFSSYPEALANVQNFFRGWDNTVCQIEKIYIKE